MFQDQDNGFRVWRLYKDKWTDVAKDIESLVKKSNDIQFVSNSVSQEIERRRDLILSEPDGIVREQMISNLALDL